MGLVVGVAMAVQQLRDEGLRENPTAKAEVRRREALGLQLLGLVILTVTYERCDLVTSPF